MKRVLYVVRHCEATGQESDCELTEKGQLQAYALAVFFEDVQIDKIISSPFTRAINSIKPLANQLHLEASIDENLSERILSSNNLPDWLDCLEQTFNDFSLTYTGVTLILKYFDEQFGFKEWKRLTNPDVYKATLDINPKVKRVWKG